LEDDLPILIDLVPLIEKLFPKDEYRNEKIDVSPTEAEERTLRLIRSFLSCVALDDRPLVLFVDDLQWGSTAESSVLCGLISSFRVHASATVVRNCLLIISYRVNELPQTTLQKLNESLDKVRRKGGPLEIRGAVEISVGALHLVIPLD
jgi:predicted ATPase